MLKFSTPSLATCFFHNQEKRLHDFSSRIRKQIQEDLVIIHDFLVVILSNNLLLKAKTALVRKEKLAFIVTYSIQCSILEKEGLCSENTQWVKMYLILLQNPMLANIKNKHQNIKAILYLSIALPVFCICHPRSGLTVNGGDKKLFLIYPAAPTCARAPLGMHGIFEVSQRSMKSTTISISSSHCMPPISSRSPVRSDWGSFCSLFQPPWPTYTWATSQEQHIPTCQTFGVISSACNF